ncbi:MAG: ABC transporter permease subunit [Geodermatophilaceae bacterium]
MAEIVRAGILSIDKGQSEAAYGIGMRKWQVMTFILLPQAIRRMLPVLIAQLVVLLKDSSLGFIIGYFELLRSARSLVEFFRRRFRRPVLIPDLRGRRAHLHLRERDPVDLRPLAGQATGPQQEVAGGRRHCR